MSNNVDVRKASEDDWPQISALAQQLELSLGDADRFFGAESRGVLGVATGLQGERLGFVAAQWVRDEAEILDIGVAKSARRTGFGKALLGWVMTQLMQQGCVSCHLEVRASNHAAIGLYLSGGFVQVGKRAAYYRDGEDALILRLAPLGASAPAR